MSTATNTTIKLRICVVYLLKNIYICTAQRERARFYRWLKKLALVAVKNSSLKTTPLIVFVQSNVNARHVIKPAPLTRRESASFVEKNSPRANGTNENIAHTNARLSITAGEKLERAPSAGKLLTLSGVKSKKRVRILAQ